MNTRSENEMRVVLSWLPGAEIYEPGKYPWGEEDEEPGALFYVHTEDLLPYPLDWNKGSGEMALVISVFADNTCHISNLDYIDGVCDGYWHQFKDDHNVPMRYFPHLMEIFNLPNSRTSYENLICLFGAHLKMKENYFK